MAARYRFGLYRRGELVGVAVFSHPTNNRVLTSLFPGELRDSCELGRFVLLDDVEGNGESWMLSRCFHHLKRYEGIIGVVSFSDPVPRATADNRIVHGGHVGTIYQSLSAHLIGVSTPRTLRLLPDARVFSDRSAQKIRAGERGWEAAARLLQSYGATAAPRDLDRRIQWLNYWKERLTRPLPHSGNYKYAWGLVRSVRRALPESLPYPKMTRAQLALWN